MNRLMDCSVTGVLMNLVFQPGLWNGDNVDQTFNDVLGFDSFRFSMEIRQDAVPEYRIRQSLNVFDRHVVTAIHESESFCPKDEEL